MFMSRKYPYLHHPVMVMRNSEKYSMRVKWKIWGGGESIQLTLLGGAIGIFWKHTFQNCALQCILKGV